VRKWAERRARRWRLFWAARKSLAAKARRRRRLKLSAFIISLGAALFVIDQKAPSQHLPWRPLQTEAPIGFATKMQLFRLSLSPSSVCEASARQAAQMNSIPADPKDAAGPCGWQVARLMQGTAQANLKPGEATLQCPLALGVYIWMQDIDRLAKKRFGEGLEALHHAGSYSCRRQRGNSSSAWSEHAFANAFDITGFTLTDGRVISVLKDWDGAAERAKFLREVRGSACNIFRVTLSPDYNAAHHDHFHVDMGPAVSCR